MEFKVVTFLTLLCVMQGINSNPLSPFWGSNPYLVNNPFFAPPPPINPQLQPIVSEIQMRLSQAQAISKSTIGLNVGLASKNIGMVISQAKTTVKALVNDVQSNPNNTKECLKLNKNNIDLINTQSKNQLSFCSKSSQVLLKSMNQVHKEFSLQVATLTTELNMAINQCQLENPLPTDTAAVTECVTLKVEALKEKVAALEQNILSTVQSVDTSVGQVVNDAKMCTQQVQDLVQQQTADIAEALDQCSNTLTTE